MSEDFSENLSEYAEGVGSLADVAGGVSVLLASPDKTEVDMASLKDEQTFNLSQCKAETVMVYLDRAEVARSFKASITAGENEILVTSLSPCLDKDSVRVEVKGKASITEVIYSSSPADESSGGDNTNPLIPASKEEELRQLLESATRKENQLQTKKHRLTKQREVLDSIADSLINSNNAISEKENDKPQLDNNTLLGMSGFFDLYEKQATRLDMGLHDLRLDLDHQTATTNRLKKQLADLEASGKVVDENRQMTLLLDGSEDEEIEVLITYVVTKARWTPKYDIRVFSNDAQLKIMYYGMVQQSTGEDWDDVKLCLSTTMPGVGGAVPDLGTQKLAFKPKEVVKRRTQNHRHSRRNRLSLLSGSEKAKSVDYDDKLVHSDKEGNTSQSETTAAGAASGDTASVTVVEPTPPASAAVQEPMEVKDSITSTMYEITRRATIVSNNEPHKVSIAIIDLQPTFEYETIPRKSTHAFLKSKIKNTSPYALLAGPTNVFLDNNFVAKADLKAVSPSEDFTCSLGADPGVQITYHPLHKYREQSGVISKTITITHKQTIEIKNSHREPIHILVSDHLPLSTEEKIKVQLLEPAIKHPEKHDMSKPIRLNRQNNIEWDVEVPAGEKKELVLKYTIDYPVLEELETCVAHSLIGFSEC